MKHAKTRPHYPRTLIDLQHLEGGSYGRLTLIARDSDTLEIQLGSDFVRINAEGAFEIGELLTKFGGGPPRERIEVEIKEDEDEDGEDDERVVVTVTEDPQPKLPRTRRAARRRSEPPTV
jgi:hypothetical protein